VTARREPRRFFEPRWARRPWRRSATASALRARPCREAALQVRPLRGLQKSAALCAAASALWARPWREAALQVRRAVRGCKRPVGASARCAGCKSAALRAAASGAGRRVRLPEAGCRL